jgi:DNA-binding transcriptional MocR family regulator
LHFNPFTNPVVLNRLSRHSIQTILNGHVKARQRLPSELELTQQVGVGRSAVREAMKVMETLASGTTGVAIFFIKIRFYEEQ